LVMPQQGSSGWPEMYGIALSDARRMVESVVDEEKARDRGVPPGGGGHDPRLPVDR